MSNIKYKKEDIELAVKKSLSVSGVMRELGFKILNGGYHTHISRKIKEYGIDCSHFLGSRANSGDNHRGGPQQKMAKDVLVIGKFSREKPKVLKRCIIEMGIQYKCVACENKGEWLNSSLVLEIDHINGNPLDNRIENLRFLCPNCHSQTTKSNINNLVMEKKSTIEKKINNEKIKKELLKRKCIVCGRDINTTSKKFCSYECSSIGTRKINRPSFETLKNDLLEMPIIRVAKKYGVSNTAIKKWIINYKKQELEKLSLTKILE